ncbi:MAG: hypothetical protein IMF16_09665 [Proteobacteria bacterium]|nr:hypothetical protein [Pseudomonadota bacterium]
MKTRIVVGDVSIADCEAKIQDFVDHDAYRRYDRDGVRAERDPNVISSEQLTLMNSAMRARASRKAWKPFLGRPLQELARVPTDVDLIVDSQARVGDALVRLRAAIQAVQVPWITDMAATKLFFLKRPKLVAISDDYVRRRLGISGSAGADRAIAVAEAIRELGSRNRRALQDLHECSAAMRDPDGECVVLSKARILDILLWIEEALPAGRHKFWSGRYPVAE